VFVASVDEESLMKEAICPKNYNGCAKGMEAAGVAKIVRRLFENEEDKCFVAHLVTDDDSSVCKI
jgi:hypothetical protein